ncbi:MAG: lysine--tRNA ligase [Candidatus Calescibacterium sp.]|nr:lysine--tRNA ligase [Candidatus Calescibacterium sp.]MDW8132666.1 lysine--tRNA ligase [Candidatus Calescibacterium sp.]
MENYRLRHMEELKKNGINPFGYPLKKRPNITVDDLKKKYKNEQELPNQTFITGGRILNTRHHGKSIFADLLGQEEKIQIYLKKDELDQKFDIFKDNIDNGDWIMVEGFLFRTKTGEITIHIKDYDFLSKCLLELPEKWHGLKNPEIRYRQRYLDLFVNPQVKKNFVIRNKIIKFLRNYLDNLGFIEVETPMLNIIPTGALAKPFKTFHNALGTEMFLRIAPELYLKRLIVGNFEKVYELGKVFRNEGISTKHNPEFTILELYQAFADLSDMINLTENLISDLVFHIHQTKQIDYQGKNIDFSTPFRKISFPEELYKKGVDIEKLRQDKNYLEKVAKDLNIANKALSHVIDKSFDELVKPDLINPTFVIDYPVEISPLAISKSDNPMYVERFELFVANFEIANAFSELNDPFEQESRFTQQKELKETGEEEAHEYDEDYINALKYGLPPTGGLGFGIDRIVMILTNQNSIREIILFPAMLPKEE